MNKWMKKQLEFEGSFTFLRFRKKTRLGHKLPGLNAWELTGILYVVIFMSAYLYVHTCVKSIKGGRARAE